MTGRYAAHGAEAEFEPGSRRRVLRNLQGIRLVRAMQLRESEALLAATEQLIDETDVAQRLSAADVCHIHKVWLEAIYPWAGQYRSVNVTKDGFPFAAAAQVPKLMREFEAGPLREYTPCRFSDRDDQVKALAVTHAELVLIHPFREGNGRCARLLATLMGLQAGLPPLDFGGIRGVEKARYFSAVRASVGHDYQPMMSIFGRVVSRTLRIEARRATA